MFLSFLLLIALLANIWLSWVLGAWAGVVGFLISIPIVAILVIGGGVAVWLVNVLIGKKYEYSYSKRFWMGFSRGWAWLICVIWLLPWWIFGIVLGTNQWAPATLPRITMSNGDKTVIFQSMMHIASPGFYSDIRSDMQRLVWQDYVFFYEWVRPGTPENLEKLGTLLGTSVSSEMYDTIGNIAWLVSQTEESFTDILPSTNVDISTDDIVTIAERENIPVPTQTLTQTDLLNKLAIYYPHMNWVQKYVAQVFSRAAMNMILRVYERPDLVTQLEGEIPVYSVILWERNKNIASTIEATPSQKIYIHYGAMHYAWVLALLQRKDPRWKEISRTEFVVIR